MEGEDFAGERTQSPLSFETNPRDSVPRRQTEEPPTNPRAHRKTNSGTSASGKSTASSIFDLHWRKQHVLSLDGGGIRGYSALLIIQELMNFIIDEERRQYEENRERTNLDKEPFQEDKFSSYDPLPFPSEDSELASSGQDLQEIRSQRHISRTWLRNRKEAGFIFKKEMKHDHENEAEAEDRHARENQTAKAEVKRSRFLPCHYFDYIGGTSTGGLIAILLSRLRMPIDEALKAYETFGKQIFGHPRIFSIRGPVFFPRDKYSADRLADVFKEVVEARQSKKKLHAGDRSFMSNERMCKTIAIAFEGHRVEDKTVTEIQAPYLFRSYDHLPHDPPYVHERNPGYSQRVRIWQVARATTAAPTYFDSITIDDCRYGDGGFGLNNPILEIFHEVCTMNNNAKNCFGLLMSVGTGASKRTERYSKSSPWKYFAFMKAARKLAADAENAHEEMNRIVRRDKKPEDRIPYHRFNVPYQKPQETTQQPAAQQIPLGDMKLDQWQPETLSSIEEATRNYLSDTTVSDELRKIAKDLVTARRARSVTMYWELYSTGAEYRCMYDDCFHLNSHKMRPHDCNLRGHLRKRHSIKEEETLDGLVNRGRCEY